MQGRRNNGAATWGGKYSNEGQVDFTLQGTVNGIREDVNNEVDYVSFFITNPIKNDNICLFIVTVDWTLPQLEEGDKVNIFGVMRTWKTDGQGPKIELVAQQIEKVEQEVKKGRRS